MDRKYKAKDRITVYTTNVDEAPVDVFHAQPYSLHGYDNYAYKGVMYLGFYRAEIGTYILLDQPCPPITTSPHRH